MPHEPQSGTGRACIEIALPDADATDRVGAALGHAVRVGDLICLAGGLGAGKTALARAALTARLANSGLAEDIPSPTFTLVQTYQADISLWHADLYRLSDEEEVWELGLTDAFEEAAVFVEWPERLGSLLPSRRLDILLESKGEGRHLTACCHGAAWEPVVTAMRSAA